LAILSWGFGCWLLSGSTRINPGGSLLWPGLPEYPLVPA